jgi:hypothetical protein
MHTYIHAHGFFIILNFNFTEHPATTNTRILSPVSMRQQIMHEILIIQNSHPNERYPSCNASDRILNPPQTKIHVEKVCMMQPWHKNYAYDTQSL